MNKASKVVFGCLISLLTLSGCAKPFNRPAMSPGDRMKATADQSSQLDGNALFKMTLDAHTSGINQTGKKLNDLNVALTGQWRRLITRIQPLVTDYGYRVSSEERLIIDKRIYSAFYTGPDGTKKVVRTPDSVRVFYNGEESFDQNTLDSTAMTADAFFYFLLGPIALQNNENDYTRLPDVKEKKRTYYRIYTELTPGFGLSERDEMILWIDSETNRTFRMVFTLEGYPSTKGAHADVTFLDYTTIDGVVLPIDYHERVLAPINIHAHSWTHEGLDLNRDIEFSDVDGPAWSGNAQLPAKPIATQ